MPQLLVVSQEQNKKTSRHVPWFWQDDRRRRSLPLLSPLASTSAFSPCAAGTFACWACWLCSKLCLSLWKKNKIDLSQNNPFFENGLSGLIFCSRQKVKCHLLDLSVLFGLVAQLNLGGFLPFPLTSTLSLQLNTATIEDKAVVITRMLYALIQYLQTNGPT
jgi:hypothetical protein